MQRLAIIGSGIAGLGSAWFLHRDFELTVFEADNRLGGHAHTVNVDEDGRRVPVDTGFMVFNHVTYPNLVRLFRALDVPMKRTDMSFSVQHTGRELEYSGSSLNHLFAQRRNLLRPSFYRMLARIDRFNREAAAALHDPAVATLTLEEYVRRGNYGEDFLQLYLVPMSSAVWSTPPEKMLRFPAATLLHFFHNHGFLGLHTQHPWWTLDGGSQVYVEKISRPFRDRTRVNSPVREVRREAPGRIAVSTAAGTERFDRVIFACHPPATLKLLTDAAPEERRLLAPFQYQANTASLHTDRRVMPRTSRAWSSWNYRLDALDPHAGRNGSNPAGAGNGVHSANGRTARPAPRELRVSTHYWMNRLQNVSDRRSYFVSLDGQDIFARERVLKTIEYEHPLFDLGAVAAQRELGALNAAARGGSETYFCGAWQRYGFHEDGLHSAVELSRTILGRDPWEGTGA